MRTMRILATGFLTRQHTSRRQRDEKKSSTARDYTCTEDMFFDALERLGHDVDYRLPTFEETDLASRYDLAFVGLAGAHQTATFGKRFKVVAAMAQLPCVFYVSDWQLSHLSSMLKSGMTSFFSTTMMDDEAYGVNNDRIVNIINRMRFSINTLVIPTHAWGNAADYRTNHNVWMTRPLGWDPTPLALEAFHSQLNADRPSMNMRNRRWVLASLLPFGDRLKKMRLKWPVIGAWSKGHEYIPEKTLVDEWMSTNVGVIAPSRWSGCKMAGWWRLRSFLSMAARAVILADHREMSGVDLSAFPDATAIERMSAAEHEDLVLRQRTQILSKAPSMDECLHQLQSYLETAQVRV